MNERDLAQFIITDIFETGAYNNIILSKTLSKENLSSEKRAFVTELVNGTLRRLITIDYVLSLFSKTKKEKMRPFILNTLRVAIYQILFMPTVPDSAACNEAVKNTKAHRFERLSGFVNGVLRNISRQKDNIDYTGATAAQTFSRKYSVPEFVVGYWLESKTEKETEQLCASFCEYPRIYIRVNTLKTSAKELKQRLIVENVTVCDTIVPEVLEISKTGNIAELSSFKEGLFFVSDLAACLVTHITDVKPGQTVADLCAAPGGKSFSLAMKMQNKGKIYSCDIYEHKTELIEKGAKRLGIDIIEPTISDACVTNEDLKADVVLIDAPCSGLGLLKRKPDIAFNRNKEDIDTLAALQRKILEASIPLVKDGGKIVYSTCTISKKENGDNVEYIRKKYGLKAVPFSLPGKGENCGEAEILPGDYSNDGFYVAVLEKV